MPIGIHHSVVVVLDLEASLRFYRDGLGLDLLQDRHVEGDWPTLFDAIDRPSLPNDLARSPDHRGIQDHMRGHAAVDRYVK